MAGLVGLWLWSPMHCSGRPGAPGTTVQATPEPLRIVCVGGEKFMRCPSACEVDEQGEASCQCQDFYYQRGDQPLTFSHSLCR